MNLSVGIVGLPNAGKSTLFNALLKKQQALVASYPFATIEPNVGIVPVPDDRLKILADIVQKNEGVLPPIVPAVVQFVDIAGLVKGAAEGEGLGNKFLAHIREVDIICHVIRFFTDSDVTHVAGEVDPLRDKEIVETELLLADLQTLKKQVEPRGVKDKEQQKRWDRVIALREALDNGKKASEIITDEKDKILVKDLNLLTAKKILYVCNLSENQINDSGVLKKCSTFSPSITICAKIEQELSELSEIEQKEYLKSLGFEKSGLDRLIEKAYKTLNLISFLTMGIIEVRAWTIAKDTRAQDAAGVIHTDFIKKFIKADVITFKDIIKVGSFTKARENGLLRIEGRDYLMQDGDVVEFRIGS